MQIKLSSDYVRVLNRFFRTKFDVSMKREEKSLEAKFLQLKLTTTSFIDYNVYRQYFLINTGI